MKSAPTAIMERLYLFVVNRPKTLLLLLFILTCVFGVYAKDIRLDSSVESLLSQDNPDSQYYAEVRQLFGSDEVGVVGLLATDIYTADVLHKITRLTEALGNIEGVQEVLSLTNALDPIADVIEPPPLVTQVPTDQAGLDALRETLADRPIYLKNLVSEDGKAAAINIFFADMDDEEFMQRGIDEQIQAILDTERKTGPEQLFYTGLPRFKVYSARAMQDDLSRFIPLTLLAIVLVLFLSFRSLPGVLLPALTILVSLIWTLGIMVLAGSSLSLGSIALPPLILVLGTAYSLHMVAEYYELARPDESVREVVLEALKKTSPPICITALTTVLGFLSLGCEPARQYSSNGDFLVGRYSDCFSPLHSPGPGRAHAVAPTVQPGSSVCPWGHHGSAAHRSLCHSEPPERYWCGVAFGRGSDMELLLDSGRFKLSVLLSSQRPGSPGHRRH